jgi:DNA replication licensing factor MCM5
MRAKVRKLDGSKANVKTAIPITVRQLEAIIRISEALAKMTLSPVATERHVDEAIRLFNFSTMNAIQSGMVEGLSRGQFADEVHQVEDVIRRRFPVGSTMPIVSLKAELQKQDFSDTAIDRAIYQLEAKEVLHSIDRRTKIKRIKS